MLQKGMTTKRFDKHSDADVLAAAVAAAAEERETTTRLAAALKEARARGLLKATDLAEVAADDGTVRTPQADGTVGLSFAIPRQTFDKLLRVQELTGDATRESDVSQILDRALTLLIKEQEGRE